MLEVQPDNSVQTSGADAEILKEARDWRTMVALYESETREEYDRCNRFRALDQWPKEIKEARGAIRPSLVVDHTGQFIDQVVNDWRRNRVGIQVSPGDESADTETAQIYDGIIRETEYRSKAHVARDRAFDQMTGGNRAFTRIVIERRRGSFRRDLRIEHIPNPACVYFDPFAVRTDYSDAMRCLVEDTLGLKQYHAEWGKKAAEIDFTAAASGAYGDWITKESIRVAEWWVKKKLPRKIQRLNQAIVVIRNGQPVTTDVVYDDEWDPKDPIYSGAVEVRMRPDGTPMEDDEPKIEVWQYIVNGAQVLDKQKWDGTYIPIIPWFGKELLIGGKKRLYSLISRILDPQQALNFAVSASASAAALTPINPLVGYVGQNKTNEKAIAESNRVPYAFLGFDLVYDQNGNLVPAPTRQNSEPQIEGTSYLAQQMIQFMKAGVGMYGASLGDREGKTRSGVAERALQQEGDNATFDFLDNGARAVELEGCQIVELIPKVYSVPELLQIRDAQNRVTSVAVNQPIEKMPEGRRPKDQRQSYMLAEGKYNVAVSAAPSHETLRREGEERILAMMELTDDPAIRQKMMLTSMRLSGNFILEQVANEVDPPKDEVDPKAVMAQLKQAMQVIEMQTGTIQELEQEKQAKSMDIASREKIAAMQSRVAVLKIKADLIMKNEEMTSNEHVEELKISTAQEEAELDRQIDTLSQSSAQDHEREMAEAGHAQTLEQQQQAAELAPKPQASQ